ncbi:hypothetical protein Tco_0781542 [Tanacetum coccineum]
MAYGKLHDKSAEGSWEIIEGLALYDNESWNNPGDLVKPVKAISFPSDVPSTSDRRLIQLKNQVQCLMEAQISPKPSFQVNKVASSCEICSGPHDTQYFMENPKQAIVDYASSRTNAAGVNQMHNDIMLAGSKERPLMLALNGDNPRQLSHTKKETYENTNLEARALIDAKVEAVHLKFNGIGNDIYSTVDSCQNVEEIWIAIERLQQVDSINIHDIKTKLLWDFGKFTLRDEVVIRRRTFKGSPSCYLLNRVCAHISNPLRIQLCKTVNSDLGLKDILIVLFGHEAPLLLLGLKVFLMLFEVTATLIDVNAAHSKLVMLKNFNKNYSKCLRQLVKLQLSTQSYYC